MLTLAGCLVGRGRRSGGPLRGAVHAGRDLAGHALHVGCRLCDRGDDALDVGLEAVGHLALQGLLLEFGLLLGGLLRLAHAARLRSCCGGTRRPRRPWCRARRVRSLPGIVTSISPPERRFMTAVIAASGRDRPRPSRNASTIGADQDGDGAEDQVALRARRCRLILGRVLDDFEQRDRLAGVILDLPDIERGGMAADRGVAAQGPRRRIRPSIRPAVATTPSPKVEDSFLKILAVERVHGEVDAEALLGAVDEFLAEGDADVGIARLLPSRMIGVMPKMPSASRPGSTPTIGLPVLFASTTVRRRAEMSSPNDFGIVDARKIVAGGSSRSSAGCPGPSAPSWRRRAAPPDRRGRPWRWRSATGGSAATTELTASAARPS